MNDRATQDLTDLHPLLINEEGRRRGIGSLLLLLVQLELLFLALRLAVLVRRVCAGGRPVARRRRVPRDLPERFAWLLQMVPLSRVNNEALYRLMARPEMVALVARAPKIRRGWRPSGRGAA